MTLSKATQYTNGMEILNEILVQLLKKTLTYKGVRVNILGIPQLKNTSPGVLRTTLYTLHKKGFIRKQADNWQITSLGKKYVIKKQESLKRFSSEFKDVSQKNLIVMFDIPESRKAEREWLRWHLKKFNYEMIQRSVWVGPSPLPKEFTEYLQKIKIQKHIKTLKLRNDYKK